MTAASSDDLPPYQRIASTIRSRIVSGEWPSGFRVPSHRELAAQYGVARGTVQAALRLLATDGLIVSRQGSGSFVAAQPVVGRAASSPTIRVHRSSGTVAVRWPGTPRWLLVEPPGDAQPVTT
jgi:DNA-binding GntR family transcriptional regulator